MLSFIWLNKNEIMMTISNKLDGIFSPNNAEARTLRLHFLWDSNVGLSPP